MKYAALVLLLLLASLSRSPVFSMPTSTYRAEAWFQSIDEAGVSTDLTVVVEQHGKAANIRMVIDRTSPACVNDPHDCPASAISASTNTLLRAGDFVVARDLTWATLHTTVDVTDGRSGQKVAIRIDLDWTAVGERHAASSVPSTDLVEASARGVVAAASTSYLAGGGSWSGSITRS